MDHFGTTEAIVLATQKACYLIGAPLAVAGFLVAMVSIY